MKGTSVEKIAINLRIDIIIRYFADPIAVSPSVFTPLMVVVAVGDRYLFDPELITRVAIGAKIKPKLFVTN